MFELDVEFLGHPKYAKCSRFACAENGGGHRLCICAAQRRGEGRDDRSVPLDRNVMPCLIDCIFQVLLGTGMNSVKAH